MNGENTYPLGPGVGAVAIPYPLYQRFQTLLDGIGLAGPEGYRFASHLVDVCHQHAEAVVLRPATHPHDALCATWDLVGDTTLDVLLAHRPQLGEPRRQAPLRPMAFRITVAGHYAGGGHGDEVYRGDVRDVLMDGVLRRRIQRDGCDLLEEAPERPAALPGDPDSPELMVGFARLGAAYSPVPVATDWRPGGAA